MKLKKKGLRLEWKKRNLYQNKQDFLIRQCVVIRECPVQKRQKKTYQRVLSGSKDVKEAGLEDRTR